MSSAKFESAYDDVQNEDNDLKEIGEQRDRHVAMGSAGWGDFSLNENLERAIRENGFEHPSPVQQEVIPQALAHKDLLVQAKSGMGKTAVFVLSILQMLDPHSDDIQAVVVSHTRELAQQTFMEFQRFGRFLPNARAIAIFGGKESDPEIVQMRCISSVRPAIISATMGRITSLITNHKLDVSKVKFFVVDECDSVIQDEKSRADLIKLFTLLPRDKQVMMFSATIDDQIALVCKRFMTNPEEIFIDSGEKLILEGLTQYYVKVPEEKKNRRLAELLDSINFNQCIIFVNSNARAVQLCDILVKINYPAYFTHARLPVDKRLENYRKFKKGEYRIIVATDFWDRSLDIEHVNFVMSYDLPPSAHQENYLHRIGRAGRFGTKGISIAFISTEEDVKFIEAVQKKFLFKITELKDDDEIDPSLYGCS